jgi:hypothetical protein
MKNTLIAIVFLVSGLAGCGVEWFPSPPPNVQISTTVLPNAVINTAYSQTLSAFGGTPPYTWAVANGSTLPSGLTLSSAGVLSGTPSAASTTTFSVTVTDSSNPVTTATQSLSLVVGTSNTSTLSPSQSLTITAGQTVLVPSGTTFTPVGGVTTAITGNVQVPSGSLLAAPGTANTAIIFTVTGV